MRRKLIVGNWKMHGDSASCAELAAALASGVPGDLKGEVAVCVPFPYLQIVGKILATSPVALGAQTVSEFPLGAYTGEVSASMLHDLGCHYVIVGHSERRSIQGESDELIARKYLAALSAGLTPVFCVGETLGERESGRTEAVIGRQLSSLIGLVGEADLAKGVLAYEPVWAIGTGLTAMPDVIQEVHAFIRGMLAKVSAELAQCVPVLYGGSVKPLNAASIFAQQDVDGGLVGGAALVPGDFISICRAI